MRWVFYDSYENVEIKSTTKSTILYHFDFSGFYYTLFFFAWHKQFQIKSDYVDRVCWAITFDALTWFELQMKKKKKTDNDTFLHCICVLYFWILKTRLLFLLLFFFCWRCIFTRFTNDTKWFTLQLLDVIKFYNNFCWSLLQKMANGQNYGSLTVSS